MEEVTENLTSIRSVTLLYYLGIYALSLIKTLWLKILQHSLNSLKFLFRQVFILNNKDIKLFEFLVQGGEGIPVRGADR